MIDQTPDAWRRTVRRRVAVAAAIFAAWAAVVEGRLVQLQILQHAELQAYAERQQSEIVTVPAKRGEILDRHGRVLARSIEAYAIVAVPTEVKDASATAAALCRVLDDCTADERDVIAGRLKRQKMFAFVRHADKVSFEAAERVRALGLPGIGFLKEPRRFYPNEDLAAHVLGYVGTDANKGLNGVEAAYDKTIKGRDGTVLIRTDASRHPFGSEGQPPTPGAALQLTIDQVLQYVAESELKAGVEENHAAGGSVVIMDPYTGDILALANWPTFNPNTYRKATEIQLRNRAVQDVYEPGSTFKVVTASAALEEHVLSPNDPIDTSGGLIRIGSRVVHDVHKYGVLSFTDVIVKSSNVGAIRIGLRLGAERLGRYVHRYGFGTRLSPDFRGENAGLVFDPARWNDSVVASVSMGYQVGVTPLQMATAVSAVANGGILLHPRIVKGTIDADGRRRDVQPSAIRRAVLKSTADQMTTIMENVVERGTATVAKIPGFTIAGKTGTAAKLDNGHYSKSNYNASFVGFIPSRKPAVTIVVVIDSPHGPHGFYGGSVSAPVFKRIAEKTMQHLGVAPNLEAAPPLVVASREPAPQVRTAAPATRVVPAIVPALSGQAATPHVLPDVLGLSAREAIRVLARVGGTPRVTGDGVVVQQEPRAGTAIDGGTRCSLALGRLPVSVPTVSDQRQ